MVQICSADIRVESSRKIDQASAGSLLSDATTIEEIYNVWNLLLDLDCYLLSAKDCHGLKTLRSSTIFVFGTKSQKIQIRHFWWFWCTVSHKIEVLIWKPQKIFFFNCWRVNFPIFNVTSTQSIENDNFSSLQTREKNQLFMHWW